MGGGIAMVLADKGIQVRFKDINLEGIDSAMQAASKHYKKAVKAEALPQGWACKSA